MANINVKWTGLTVDPGDIDNVQVYRSTTKNSEAAFQTSLSAINAGTSDLTTEGLLQVGSDLAWNAGSVTDSGVSTGDYYYAVVAKNQGGYKVGSENSGSELTAVPDATTSTQGAVGFISV
jgi:hypothetical protein